MSRARQSIKGFTDPTSTFHVVGAGLLIVASTYGLARYTYGLFVPAIQAEFHLSTAAIGLLGSASYAGYLAATLLGSTLSGSLGPRGPIIAGGLAAAAGMALIGLAPSLPWLAVGIVLAGTSPGLAYPPLSDAVVQLRSPERQGRTYALINSGTSYGIMISAPLALWAGQQWQIAWLAFACIAVIATVWNSRIMPTAPPRGAQQAIQPLSWRWLLQPRSVPLFSGALLFGVTSAVYWTFAVDHIAGYGDLPGGSAQLFWILVGLAGVAGGSAGDGVAWFGLKNTFRVALFANAAACALLGFAAGQWSALLLSALLFGSTFILITGLFGIWSVHVFQERPSAGFGATFFLISAGQLISPAIAGMAADHLGLGWVFDMTALGTLAVMVCLPSGDIRQMSDANSKMEALMDHEHLEDIVKTSLGTLAPLSIGDIDTVSNTDKYAIIEKQDEQNDAELENIFSYMAELNEAAVNNESLCAGKESTSIRDCLCHTADFIAAHAHGKPIRYVEIGPEPHKTTLILEHLEKRGINLDSYVGIDINPRSEMRMRQVLEPIIGSDRFRYIIGDYNTLTADDLEAYEGLTVITMLGFQEGNETPDKMAGILAGLTKPGDLLFSEMQLNSGRGYGPIINFYDSHPMKQFSDSVCKRNHVVAADQHSIFVIPIETKLGGIMVAATIVPYK